MGLSHYDIPANIWLFLGNVPRRFKSALQYEQTGAMPLFNVPLVQIICHHMVIYAGLSEYFLPAPTFLTQVSCMFGHISMIREVKPLGWFPSQCGTVLRINIH